jgi:hypothetical protein
MAKRSVDEGNSIGLEVGQAEVVDTPASTVRLVLLRNVRLNIAGPVTGQMYYFLGAGSYADVDALDAPGMLTKRSASSCCTGETSPYFQVGG